MLKKIWIFIFLLVSFLWLANLESNTDKNLIINYVSASGLTNVSGFGSSGFTINVNEIAPADRVEWNNINEVTNNLLGTIIQSLMVPLWAIALLIMTIWAWYMIFYHWQDELLSKWKSIFNSWLIALVIALGSYYIVSLVRFILYSNNF